MPRQRFWARLRQKGVIMKKLTATLLALGLAASTLFGAVSAQAGEIRDEVVTMAIISTWNTLNVYNTSGNYGHCVADQLFERMVTCNHNGEYIPRLATSWEMSEDNSQITFHLNTDATWHDGNPLTAEDVVFTLQAMTNDAVDNYYRAEFSSLLGTDENGICANPEELGVEAPDAATVTISFKKPKAMEKKLLISLIR